MKCPVRCYFWPGITHALVEPGIAPWYLRGARGPKRGRSALAPGVLQVFVCRQIDPQSPRRAYACVCKRTFARVSGMADSFRECPLGPIIDVAGHSPRLTAGNGGPALLSAMRRALVRARPPRTIKWLGQGTVQQGPWQAVLRSHSPVVALAAFGCASSPRAFYRGTFHAALLAASADMFSEVGQNLPRALLLARSSARSEQRTASADIGGVPDLPGEEVI